MGSLLYVFKVFEEVTMEVDFRDRIVVLTRLCLLMEVISIFVPI